jgi:trans-aconitate methyltransferase
MTALGQTVAAPWRDPDFVAGWVGGDSQDAMLDFPRRMAAVIAGADNPRPALVVDIGSGPGGFLGTLLAAFPGARGVWFDASEAMREVARQRLSALGDRVEYVVGDMTDLAGGGVPQGADLIVTARAAHHLDAEALQAFYRSAYGLLSPGGWLANLDHVEVGQPWGGRLRSARAVMLPRRSDAVPHPHTYPLPSLADHLGALAGAGFEQPELVWRAFMTCLVMGRKAG